MRRTLLIAFAVVAAVAALLAPVQAFAVNYSIDELSTEIAVETNGTTHNVERQVYTFSGANEGCVWYLHVPESGEAVRISNVRVAPVDDGGTLVGDWTRLQAIDVNRRLQGDKPGDKAINSLRKDTQQPWYSYSIGDGMIRCWFPTAADDTVGPRLGSGGTRPASTETSVTNTYIIEVDYTISHRVRVYGDVAELYWRYANSSLPVDARDVNLHVTLPVPTGAGPIVPGETIMAWGHGPDGGRFEIGQDGSVTYHLDGIESGNYAEAHLIFPATWMTNMEPNAANFFSNMRRDAAMAEESTWVDSGSRGEAWDNKVRVLFLAIAVIVLLSGVMAVMRYGRSPRARRALIRVAVTIGIVALGENLFFNEGLTTAMLAITAIVVGLVAFWLPLTDDADEVDDAGEDDGEETGVGENGVESEEGSGGVDEPDSPESPDDAEPSDDADAAQSVEEEAS